VRNELPPPSHGATELAKSTVGEDATVQNDLTGRIIGCAIEVHRRLGPGLLESIYESALAVEFAFAKISFERQVPIPIHYRGMLIGEHRLDVIVEKIVVLELKSVERFDPVFEAQLLTYLRITNLHVGLLINFNSRLLHEGIKRFVL
jgi:GxxExxY protein